jgi:hypothetical protein
MKLAIYDILLRDEELHNLYASSGIVRLVKGRLQSARHVVQWWRQLYTQARSISRWQSNIKNGPLENMLSESKVMDLAQDRVQRWTLVLAFCFINRSTSTTNISVIK